MLSVKVLTGVTRDKYIVREIANECKRLTADGWLMMHVNADFHPSEIVLFVDKLIELAKVSGYSKIYFWSNIDHLFNRLRVLRSFGVVDSVEFRHYTAGKDGTITPTIITIDQSGECSSYPKGFLDEWNNQLLQLWGSSYEASLDSKTIEATFTETETENQNF